MVECCFSKRWGSGRLMCFKCSGSLSKKESFALSVQTVPIFSRRVFNCLLQAIPVPAAISVIQSRMPVHSGSGRALSSKAIGTARRPNRYLYQRNASFCRAYRSGKRGDVDCRDASASSRG